MPFHVRPIKMTNLQINLPPFLFPPLFCFHFWIILFCGRPLSSQHVLLQAHFLHSHEFWLVLHCTFFDTLATVVRISLQRKSHWLPLRTVAQEGRNLQRRRMSRCGMYSPCGLTAEAVATRLRGLVCIFPFGFWATIFLKIDWITTGTAKGKII